MNMMAFTAQSLSDQLGRPIPEILVVIAKNDIAGLPAEDISRLIGVDTEEIKESQRSDDYRDIRLILGAAQASEMVETDFSWDAIESESTRKLFQEVKKSRDADFLLKVAAIANKAQRRVSSNRDKVLDQSKANPVIPLKLTQRFIEQMNASGDLTRITERQISVLDGSAKNPSFDKINQMLGVNTPTNRAIEKQGKGDDFDLDDLDKLHL